MVTQLIIWTCAAVFVATAVITILALIGKLNIKDEFLNKLFYTLIIEIVLACILVFKDALINKEINIVRITDSANELTFKQGDLYFVNGFCQKQADAHFSGEIIIGSKSYPLKDFKLNDRNIFSAYAQMSEKTEHANSKIVVRLDEANGKTIFSDSIKSKIIVN